MEKKIIQTLRDGRTYTKTTTSKYVGTWRRSSSTHAFYPHPQKVDEVVEYLGTLSGPFSYTEVINSDELNMSRTTAYKVLITLEDEGKIEKLGRGKYIMRVNDGTEEEQPITETVSQEGEE